MIRVCLLMVVYSLLTGECRLGQAQSIRITGQLQDYQSHQQLAGRWQWTDSLQRSLVNQHAGVGGFAGEIPKQARYLIVASSGYRTVKLPVHWLISGTDSLSFQVIVPLVPVDKPGKNQPYFQSEQRPLTLSTGNKSTIPVNFIITDALTNQLVQATLCLVPTRIAEPRCYTASMLQTNLALSDIVAIDVKAPMYQPYLGNVVIEDTTKQTTLTIRLNPTPVLLTVATAKPIQLSLKSQKNGHIYAVVPLDSTHLIATVPAGYYKLIQKSNYEPVDETIWLAEGLTAYSRSEQASFQPPLDGVIFFAQSSYTLSDFSKRTLDRVAQQLRQHPEQIIRIVGHTDAVGDPQLNTILSEFRARITQAYLRQSGIDENRCQLEAMGARQSVAPNDTEDNRKLNRRVELYIY